MQDSRYFQTLAQYNRWMNQRFYAVCADIPDDTRRKDLGAYFRSIHGTLNHLLYGDRSWLGRFIGQPFNAAIGEELYADFDELRRERDITDQQLIAWTGQLTPEWLAQPFTYTSKVDKKTFTQPSWLLVIHMFNHQTHHRGQLTTLFNQLGHKYGSTDIPRLPALHVD
jgi:uncharacterized damage-inducible protein DinB